MSLENITTYWNGENVIVVDRFNIIGPVSNPANNDFFNIDITKFLDKQKDSYGENIVYYINNKNQTHLFHNKANKEGGIDLSGLIAEQDNRLILHAVVNSVRERQAIICFSARGCSYKLWINGKIKAIASGGFSGICDMFIEGNNTIILEIANNIGNSDIFLRISDYEFETEDGYYSLRQNNYCWKNHNICVIRKSAYHAEKSCYKFMLVPADLINIPVNQKIAISVQDINGDLLDSFDAVFYTPICYDLNGIRSYYTGSPVINLRMKIFRKDNTEFYQDNWIAVTNIDKYFIAVFEKFNILCNKTQLSEEDYINVVERVKSIKTIIWEAKPFEILFLEKLLIGYGNGLYFKNIVKQPGAKCVFFKSRLDGQIERYYISVPEGYNDNQKYPLVVHLSTNRYSEDVILSISSYKKEPVIFANISGRGVTTGSYIGEATILEAIERINADFSIDTDRIYLTGYSNGAYACWSIAQTHPHLFAAIALIAGRPYAPNLKNLSGMKIVNFSSQDDYIYKEAYEIPTMVLEQYGRYTGVLLEKCIHSMLWLVLHKSIVLDFLLSNRRDNYPNKVTFRTERVLHNKAYWVEIKGIEQGKKHAQIEAELVGRGIINVSEENTSGFTLTIPAQLDRELLTVRINDVCVHKCTRYKGDAIRLIKAGDVFTLNEAEDTLKSYSSIGMGLLHIYMDSMKVVIPDKYDCMDNWGTVKNVAEKFSKPLTQGFDPVIYVNYPILSCSDMRKDQLTDSNLVLIGINESNKLINQIKYCFPIKMYANGFEYKGCSANIKYCILQICQSPFSPSKKVLVIFANEVSMMKKCLFTRNVILASYINGLHRFLNNEALIFDGEDYYSVFSWGDEIERIS